MGTLEDVVKAKNIIWGDLLKLSHCKDCCPLADSSFAYRKDENISSGQIKTIISDAADWIAYALVSVPDSNLTIDKRLAYEQKFDLIDEIKDDLYKHNAIISVSFDSKDALLLINGRKGPNGERVGGIKDEWWRYRALCNIKILSGDQNFEIVSEFVNELYILWAARDVDLRPQTNKPQSSEDELDKLESDRIFKLVDKIKNEEYICQSILEIEKLDVKESSKNRYYLSSKLKAQEPILEIIKEALCFTPEQLSELNNRAASAEPRSHKTIGTYAGFPKKKGAHPPGGKPISEYVPKTAEETIEENYVSLPKKKETPEKPAEKPVVAPKSATSQPAAKDKMPPQNLFGSKEKPLTDSTLPPPKQVPPAESAIIPEEVQITGRPFVVTPHMPLTSATDTITKTPQPIPIMPKPAATSLPSPAPRPATTLVAPSPVTEKLKGLEQDDPAKPTHPVEQISQPKAASIRNTLTSLPRPQRPITPPARPPAEKKPVTIISSAPKPKGLLEKWLFFWK